MKKLDNYSFITQLNLVLQHILHYPNRLNKIFCHTIRIGRKFRIIEDQNLPTDLAMKLIVTQSSNGSAQTEFEIEKIWQTEIPMSKLKLLVLFVNDKGKMLIN